MNDILLGRKISPHGMTIAQAARQWLWPDTSAASRRAIYLGYSKRLNARAYVDVADIGNDRFRLFCYGGQPTHDVPGHTVVTIMNEPLSRKGGHSE